MVFEFFVGCVTHVNVRLSARLSPSLCRLQVFFAWQTRSHACRVFCHSRCEFFLSEFRQASEAAELAHKSTGSPVPHFDFRLSAGVVVGCTFFGVEYVGTCESDVDQPRISDRRVASL